SVNSLWHGGHSDRNSRAQAVYGASLSCNCLFSDQDDNGNGYVGVSSPSYGTLTVFRQNSLTYDGVLEYDPMGASYAFSPIGWQGLTCGGGNTENCRHTTSLKYRLTVGQARVAAIWQFGGYGQNNASNSSYQFGVGGDIPNLANGVLSFDAIYSYVKDSVATAVLGGSTDITGTPIPPFLPAVLTATISDNRAVMLLARYTNGPLKLYAGFEQIRYSAPSDPQTAFTNIAGDFVCLGCQAFNNTNINNTAFGAAGFADRIFDVYWTGVKYAVTNQVDVIAAYYHYTQHAHRRGHVLRRQRALAMRRYVERGLWCCRLEVCTEVGCLHRRLLDGIQWRIGEQLFRERQRRYYGGIALQVLKSRGCGRSVAAVAPAKSWSDNSRLWNISLACARKTAQRAELGLLKPAIGIASLSPRDPRSAHSGWPCSVMQARY